MSFGTELVSVVIINFNSGRFLERCITALEAQTYGSLEILVVDNGSNDGSTLLLRDFASVGRIRLIEGTNVGSSKANNAGIRESHGQFILVLNADAFLDRDYLRQCVEAMKEAPDIGTSIGKLVSESDHSIIDSAGLYLYREGLAVDRGFGEKDDGRFDRREFVDGACCAAALYRRSMLDQIRIGEQFYNESFFAFVEDVELSFRASLAGWRTIYVPAAIAYHVRGGSTQSTSEFATYLNERNLRVFLHTWFNPTARISDRLLQWIVLRLRGIRIRQLLSPYYRKKLNLEIRELASKNSRSRLGTPSRVAQTSASGHRSYLIQMIRRRLRMRFHSQRTTGPR